MFDAFVFALVWLSLGPVRVFAPEAAFSAAKSGAGREAQLQAG